MSPRRRLAAAMLALLCAAPAAAIETEVGPFVSYRFGGLELPTGIVCPPLALDCSVRTESEDSLAWGLEFGMALRGPWWLELRFSQQNVDFGGEQEARAEASWDRFMIGLDHRWSPSERWGPFLVVAGGWTDFSGDLETVDASGAEVGLTHPTFELGGGLLVRHGDRLGLRLEARLSWTSLPEELGSDLTQFGLGASFLLRSPGNGR